MITLQVPEGDVCEGCMFLELDYNPDRADCRLWKEKLAGRYKYGSLDTSTIKKLDACPREES